MGRGQVPLPRRRLARAGGRADVGARALGGRHQDLGQLPGGHAHHVQRVRGRAARLRRGQRGREPLLRGLRDVAGEPQPDRHAVVSAQCAQEGRLAAGRRAAVEGGQARRARRRHDGRGHRLRVGPGRHRGRAARHHGRARRPGQGAGPGPARQGGQEGPHDARAARRAARAHPPDCGLRRPRRLRPGDRGGVRGPRGQGRGDPAGRSRARRRRRLCQQHLDAADRRARAGQRAAAQLHRAAFLQPGRPDAAGRDHRRPRDRRRDAGTRLRLRAADRQDADRRQRQPRLLYQPGVCDLRDGGHRDAARGRAPAPHRAGRAAGGHADAAAGAARRGQPEPVAARHRADPQGPRGRGPHLPAAPGRGGHPPDVRGRPRRQEGRARLLRLGRRRPAAVARPA